jgi:predicted AAA+ superfamily ATPase
VLQVIYLAVTDYLTKREKEKFEKEEAAKNKNKKKKKEKNKLKFVRAGRRVADRKNIRDKDDD